MYINSNTLTSSEDLCCVYDQWHYKNEFTYKHKSKSEKKIDDEKVFLLIKISPQPDESFPQIICIYVSRLKYSIFDFNDSRHAK